MTRLFDCILAGATVVNQDGVGPRDIGVTNGKIAEIGDLYAASAGERIDCRGLAHPARRDRQPGAFSRARPDPQGGLESGSRGAVLGGVTAVFEMPNTNPLTTSAAALEDKLTRAKGRMHCDFAFWVGGTHENVADIAELERLPGAAGIKVFMGSSTGALLVADDDGVLAILKATRRRAAFHSEDEPRLIERKSLRVAGDPSSHPSGATRSPRSARPSGWCASPARRARRCMCCTSRRAKRSQFSQAAKDVASCEATPHHLTLAADDYARLGTKMQMNPPVRGREHRDGVWRGVAQGDHRRARLRPRASYAGREGAALSRQPLRHDRRADAGADHARPRRGRPAQPCNASSI